MVKFSWYILGCAVVDGARHTEFAKMDAADNDCRLPGSKRVPDMAGESRTVEPNWQDCQARCESTSDCAYFSYWPDGGCHIQDDSAKLKFSITGTTGPVVCPGVPSTTTTTTADSTTGESRMSAKDVNSLTNWFKSMDGGFMISGARERAVREAAANPDLDVAKMKELSAFFQSMDGGHHIKTGEATNLALKELKAQPDLNVNVLKKLTAHFQTMDGGFQIRTGQACNSALKHLRAEYGPYLRVSEVVSMGIDKAVAEAKIRFDESAKVWTGVGRRFFPQDIGRQRVCIHGIKIQDRRSCKSKVPGVLTQFKWRRAGSWANRPKGCIHNAAGELFYNAHETGKWNDKYGIVCQRPNPDTLKCSCNDDEQTYKCKGHPKKSGKCKNKFTCSKGGSWYFPGVGLRSAKICMP